MTPERNLSIALTALSGLSDTTGHGVTEELMHALKRYAFLLVMLAAVANIVR